MFYLRMIVMCPHCEGLPEMKLSEPSNAGPCEPDRFICLSCDNVLLLGECHHWEDFPYLDKQQARTAFNAVSMMLSTHYDPKQWRPARYDNKDGA